MWIKILAIAVVIIAGLLLMISRKPDSFSVTRSLKIEAPASAIYPHINDVHKMMAWEPWSKADPKIKMTFEGPSAGIGSSYSWSGNSDVGSGKLEIVEN